MMNAQLRSRRPTLKCPRSAEKYGVITKGFQCFVPAQATGLKIVFANWSARITFPPTVQ
jgi:hypothetical protein